MILVSRGQSKSAMFLNRCEFPPRNLLVFGNPRTYLETSYTVLALLLLFQFSVLPCSADAEDDINLLVAVGSPLPKDVRAVTGPFGGRGRPAIEFTPNSYVGRYAKDLLPVPFYEDFGIKVTLFPQSVSGGVLFSVLSPTQSRVLLSVEVIRHSRGNQAVLLTYGNSNPPEQHGLLFALPTFARKWTVFSIVLSGQRATLYFNGCQKVLSKTFRTPRKRLELSDRSPVFVGRAGWFSRKLPFYGALYDLKILGDGSKATPRCSKEITPLTPSPFIGTFPRPPLFPELNPTPASSDGVEVSKLSTTVEPSGNLTESEVPTVPEVSSQGLPVGKQRNLVGGVEGTETGPTTDRPLVTEQARPFTPAPSKPAPLSKATKTSNVSVPTNTSKPTQSVSKTQENLLENIFKPDAMESLAPTQAGRTSSEGESGEGILKASEGKRITVVKGEKGEPGKPGKDGKDGREGKDGAPGKDGESIQGPKGEKGSKGAAGPIGPEGKVSLVKVKGLKGDRGRAGPKGEKGEAGFGVPGNTGRPGEAGIPGNPGSPGHPGPPGVAGSRGPTGLPGKDGKKGSQGQSGPMGPRGPPGPPGPPGSPAIKVDKTENLNLLEDDLKALKDGVMGHPLGSLMGNEKGVKGDMGPAGPSGEKGEMGKPGLPGLKGEKGVEGPEGMRGPRGFPGSPGVKGQQGIRGPAGPKGDEGDQGVKGELGPQGPPGVDGVPGKSVKGEKGAKGDRGEMVSKAELLLAIEELIPVHLEKLNLTSPQRVDISRHVEEFQKTILTKLGLLPQSRENATDEKKQSSMLTKEGSAVAELGGSKNESKVFDFRKVLSQLVGPRGERGLKGEKGERGLSEKGERGLRGLPGLMGLKGAKGARGDKGARGLPGQPGFDGVKGEIGKPGVPGAMGKVGPPGVNGGQGPKGDVGPSGPQGAKGETGKAGPQGPIGSAGPKGVKGDSGKDGVDGFPGKDGKKGASGDRGERGESGFKGEKGEAGAPGETMRVKGERGTPGIPGLDGAKGSKGETGLRGPVGPQGIVGPPGPPGPPGQPPVFDFKAMTTGKPGIEVQPGVTEVIPGPPGEPGPPGPPGKPGKAIQGPVGPAGPQGPRGLPGEGINGKPGIPGTPGLAGPKGEKGSAGLPGETRYVNPVAVKGEQGNQGFKGERGEKGKTGSPGPAGASVAVTILSREDLSLMEDMFQTGTLAFVTSTDDLYIRTKQGWTGLTFGKRSVNSVNNQPAEPVKGEALLGPSVTGEPVEIHVGTAPHNPVTPNPGNNNGKLKPTQSSLLQVTTPSQRKYTALPLAGIYPTKPFLRLIALNEPYSGAMGGIAGVDYQCYKQAFRHGFKGTFRAFLSDRSQTVKTVVFRKYRNLPVVNSKGMQVFSSWMDPFDTKMYAAFNPDIPIYSFNGKDIRTDNTWPVKKIWHGSHANGHFHRAGLQCRKWRSEVHWRVGIGSSLSSFMPALNEEQYPCSWRLAVLCVQVMPELR